MPHRHSWNRSARAALVLVACLSVISGLAREARAWSGVPVAVGSSTAKRGGAVTVSDGLGGLLVAWVTVGTGPEVHAQRVRSDGSAAWGAGDGVVVRSAIANSSVSRPVIETDGHGGAYVAWSDSGRAGALPLVYLAHLDSTGQRPAGSPYAADGTALVATADRGVLPVLASDDSGGVFTAWQCTGSRGDIKLLRSSASLVSFWAAPKLVAGSTNDQTRPRITRDGAGGCVVVWDDISISSVRSAYAAGYTSLGVQRGSGQRTLSANGYGPRVATDGAGRIACAWVDLGGGSHQVMGVVTQLDGTVLQTVTANFSSSTAGVGALVAIGADTFLVVHGDAAALRARRFGSAGLIGAADLAVASPAALVVDTNVVATPDGLGGAYIAWAEGSPGVVTVQRMGVDGTLACGASGASPSGGGSQAAPGVATLADHTLALAWIKDPASGTVQAQRFSPEGSVGLFHHVTVVPAPNGRMDTTTPRGSSRDIDRWLADGEPLTCSIAATTLYYHVDALRVDGTDVGPVPNYAIPAVTGPHTLAPAFAATPVTQSVTVTSGLWSSVSVPFYPTPKDSALAVFSALGTPGPAAWRLGHYDPDTGHYIEAGQTLGRIRPGVGYWLGVMDDRTLQLSGLPVGPNDTTLALGPAAVGDSLWNQFANPFRFRVAVADLRVAADAIPALPVAATTQYVTDRQVLGWDPANGYQAVSVLEPGQAYWLFRRAYGPHPRLTVPYVWSQGLPAGEPARPEGSAWAIAVDARQAGLVPAHATLGASATGVEPASLRRRVPPAGPASALTLVARGPDGADAAAAFAADGAALEWTLALASAGPLAEASLAFTFADLPADRHVELSDPAAGWTRTVRSGESVVVAASGSARQLRVRVSSGAAAPGAAPAPAAGLRALAPNPARERVALAFWLPAPGAAGFEVFDVSGRRVAARSREGLAAGEHVLEWDARDDRGARARPGVYLVRWTAAGRSGTARVVTLE